MCEWDEIKDLAGKGTQATHPHFFEREIRFSQALNLNHKCLECEKVPSPLRQMSERKATGSKKQHISKQSIKKYAEQLRVSKESYAFHYPYFVFQPCAVFFKTVLTPSHPLIIFPPLLVFLSNSLRAHHLLMMTLSSWLIQMENLWRKWIKKLVTFFGPPPSSSLLLFNLLLHPASLHLFISSFLSSFCSLSFLHTVVTWGWGHIRSTS